MGFLIAAAAVNEPYGLSLPVHVVLTDGATKYFLMGYSPISKRFSYHEDSLDPIKSIKDPLPKSLECCMYASQSPSITVLNCNQ